jgi:hypothetical protein
VATVPGRSISNAILSDILRLWVGFLMPVGIGGFVVLRMPLVIEEEVKDVLFEVLSEVVVVTLGI